MTELLTVAIITFFVAISPGPDFAIVVRNSVVSGRRAGIMTSIGIGLALWVHVFYSIIGIGAIVSQSILLFNILKIVCAVYLIYLGLRMVLSARNGGGVEMPVAEDTGRNKGRPMLIGFLTNALNPKATIFMVSLFTQVVDPTTSLTMQLVYGAIISGFHIIWFSIVSAFFGADSFRNRINSIMHWFDRVFGGVLAALGASIIVTSFQQR